MANIAVSPSAIEVVRGDSWSRLVRMYSDPDKATKYDLSGKSVECRIRWWSGSQDVTVTITDAVNGAATLSLTTSETPNIPAGQTSTLFLGVTESPDKTTWFRAPVNGKEGISAS